MSDRQSEPATTTLTHHPTRTQRNGASRRSMRMCPRRCERQRVRRPSLSDRMPLRYRAWP
jgi:hypothetical protein